MAQEPDAEIELDMGADASRTVGEFQRSCPPLTVRSITPVARWRPRRSLSRGPAEITEVGGCVGAAGSRASERGTESSNPSPSSGESGTNRCASAFFISANRASEERRRGHAFFEPSACGWDQEFESPLLQRGVACETEDDIDIPVRRGSTITIRSRSTTSRRDSRVAERLSRMPYRPRFRRSGLGCGTIQH
jgi:hypothetical protein